MNEITREMEMEGASVTLDYFLTEHGQKDKYGLPCVCGHVRQRSESDDLIRVLFTVMFVREKGEVTLHVELVAPTKTIGKENLETLWNVMAQARKLMDRLSEVMKTMVESDVHFGHANDVERVAGAYIKHLSIFYWSDFDRILLPVFGLALSDQGADVRRQVFEEPAIQEDLMNEVEKGDGVLLQCLKVIGDRLGWFSSNEDGHEIQVILKELEIKQ